tara:strand:- start:10659 stop:11192 length:534 start_codon:yes stop_codon:yes gene_type:complete
MDVISHWLWSLALTRKKISWKVSGPMGVLPDLLAFIPASIYRSINGISRTRVDDDTVTSDMPVAWEIYQWTHSFAIVAFLYCCGWYFFNKKGHENPKYMAWIFVLPWLFHILIDIPGHTAEFFPTPIFHPFSDLSFDGVRWSTWWLWFPQLFVLLGIWFVILKREKHILLRPRAWMK